MSNTPTDNVPISNESLEMREDNESKSKGPNSVLGKVCLYVFGSLAIYAALFGIGFMIGRLLKFLGIA